MRAAYRRAERFCRRYALRAGSARRSAARVRRARPPRRRGRAGLPKLPARAGGRGAGDRQPPLCRPLPARRGAARGGGLRQPTTCPSLRTWKATSTSPRVWRRRRPTSRASTGCARTSSATAWRTSPATTARRTSRRSVHRRWLLDPAMAQDRLRPGELGDGHELRGDVRPRPRQRRRRVVRGLLALGGRLSRGADARRPGVVDLAQPRSLRPRALGHHRDARGGVARAALFVPLQRRHGRRLLHGQLRRLRLRSLRHLPPGLFAGGLHGLPAEPALDGARRGPRDRGRRAGASGIRRRDGVAVRAGRRRGGAERARAQPASR